MIRTPYYDWQERLENGRDWTSKEVAEMFLELARLSNIISQLEEQIFQLEGCNKEY